MKSVIFVLMTFVVSGCAHADNGKFVPFTCQEQPPADVGQSVAFRGAVGETTADALHMDFDGFGADFSSIRLTLVSPSEWNGRSLPIYYQGRALVEGREVSSGELLSFKAVVPDCLDGPWLFLEEIKPQLLDSQ